MGTCAGMLALLLLQIVADNFVYRGNTTEVLEEFQGPLPGKPVLESLSQPPGGPGKLKSGDVTVTADNTVIPGRYEYHNIHTLPKAHPSDSTLCDT